MQLFQHIGFSTLKGTQLIPWLFTIRASGMVYKRLRVAFRFEEVEPGGVDFDLS